jgi:hypothetical protein
MRNKLILLILLPGLVGMVASAASAAELQTLFTTPAERQLINANRYRDDDEPETSVVKESEERAPIRALVNKEISREYKVSGVTISPDGAHTIWINAQSYENGARLEDDSRVEVIVNDEVRVRITTPDGKQHYALSGETLDVTYFVRVDEYDVHEDDHVHIRKN